MTSKKHLALFVVTSILVAACASPTEEIENDDANLTKRTAPKGGLGTISVSKPSWYDANVFLGDVRVIGAPLRADPGGHLPSGTQVAVGAQADFVPQPYDVLIVDRNDPTPSPSYYQFVGLVAGTPTVIAGAVTTIAPAGLQLQTDRPIVWNAPVTLASITVGPATVRGFRDGHVFTPTSDEVVSSFTAPVRASATIGKLLPAGTFTIAGDGLPAQSVTLEAGKLTKLPIIKTSTVAVELDPIVAEFPDYNEGRCVTVKALGVSERARAQSLFKSAVLPTGTPVTVTAYGIDVPVHEDAGVHRYVLNRLELDDVTIAGSGPTATKARGRAVVQYKSGAGQWLDLSCNDVSGPEIANGTGIPTGTAIDVPDGAYRIRSTANGVTSVEEISFP